MFKLDWIANKRGKFEIDQQVFNQSATRARIELITEMD